MMTATTHRAVYFLLIFCTLTANTAQAMLCSDAVPLRPGETWRDPGRVTGDRACFVVETATSGLLVVDLAVAATAARARLFVPVQATDTGRKLLRQSATSAALEVPPGSHLLQVGAEDPRAPLEPFRLQIRFVAAQSWTKDELDSELEVEPDPLIGGSATPDPAKDELDSELEVEPDPLVAGSLPEAAGDLRHRSRLPALSPARASALCLQGAADDHADDLTCATPLALGASVRGELDNTWGDDTDVFRFAVDGLTTVEIAARGEPRLLAELYDLVGQRLEVAEAGPEGLRHLRTLTPGIYFLRLEGQGFFPTSYSLRLSTAIAP